MCSYASSCSSYELWGERVYEKVTLWTVYIPPVTVFSLLSSEKTETTYVNK